MKIVKLEDLGVWEKLQKQLTWSQLNNFEGQNMLDFGCGNGVMSAYYADKNKVVAIDPDAKTILENPYQDVLQMVGDIDVLADFEDESFDVIFCHNVLEYTKNPAQIVQELSRLLKPGGIMSVLKHNRNGRVMQMAVLLNNFNHAHELLDGKSGNAMKYGAIHYYLDEDLQKWAKDLTIESVYGMRTFFDLQQNQQQQTDPQWQEKMLSLEKRVATIEDFKAIAFFHHIILVKNKKM